MSVAKTQALASFLSALESGHVIVSSDGSLLFDVLGGPSAELVIDDAGESSFEATIWASDDEGDDTEIATVRFTAEVTS